LPLIYNENLIGALEILAFEEEISADAVEALLPAAEVAAAAIATAGAYEEERHGTMTSITRLTQLYDLEKVFSSTLEMDELLPLIGTKLSEILECEAVNKLDGKPFDEDELFTLTNLAETASTALHNASLLLAERKVEVLETLNKVSHEITSTLNLERMLQTIVNAPQAVIPYERAAIALEQRGRFKLSAVTGLSQVNPDAPDIAPLNGILQWAALAEEIVNVRQHDDQIDTEREETRAKFKNYFAE